MSAVHELISGRVTAPANGIRNDAFAIAIARAAISLGGCGGGGVSGGPTERPVEVGVGSQKQCIPRDA
jgi:hypothetical protein